MSKTRVVLGREDWIHAAIEALAKHGIEGLAIEPLARSMHVSKGSFYWHFRDAKDLLRAVLDAWKQQGLREVIGRIDTSAAPEERLRRLVQEAWSSPMHLRAEAALNAAALAGHRTIKKYVEEITEARIAYVRSIYEAMHLDEASVELWTASAFAAYVGTMQLVALQPKRFGSQAQLDALAAHLTLLLLPPREQRAHGRSSTS